MLCTRPSGWKRIPENWNLLQELGSDRPIREQSGTCRNTVGLAPQ